MLLSNYAIKFRVAVLVFIVVLVLAGVRSYMSLPREGNPDITMSYVFVNAVYDGMSAEEMEKLVTIPIERQLNDLENVKEIRSTSSDSLSFISIEFLAGQDIDLALQKAKDKVDLASPDLPRDLDEPMVQGLNISSDMPIIKFALSGNTSLSRLKHLAEDLKEEIELLSGVKQADIYGTREREIRVELDLRRLASYRIPVEQVMQRIAGENKTMSVGNLEIAGDKFQVRVPGEFKLAANISDIIVALVDGKPIYLRDIATVVDTYKDLESISRLNGVSCVSISVKKRSGENTVSLISEIKESIAAVVMPPEVGLTIVMDESEHVKMMISELENNVATGFILVVIVLLVFMGFRNSLFVAIAIPFSMLITFAVMEMMGFSLNMIVLFSLILAVGMLVDNAIVIVENIYRNRTLGMTRHEAARRGASEVAWPVITSTLTTCAAFSPLIFWPGMIGQFMSFLPKTLVITLLASLFVAIVVNPAICSFFIGGRKALQTEKKKTHPFTQAYERLLGAALRHRIPVFLIGILFLVLTFQIYARFGEGKELFPDVSPRSASIEVKFPQGTSIERTDEVLRSIEAKLPKYEDIEFSLTTVGAGGGGGFLGSGLGTHLGNIHVEFLDYEDRSQDSMKLVDDLRDDIGDIAGVEIKVDKAEEGPPTGTPISIEVAGDDFNKLSEISGEVMSRIKTVQGLVDLQDDYEEALPELQFVVDRKRVAMVGLDTASIGLFLRTAIYGVEASKLRVEEEEFEITLRFPKTERSSVRMLHEVYIPTQNGGSVPLLSLGSIKYVGGRGAISRKNQKRVITISGDKQNRGVDKILEDIKVRLADYNMPAGYTITYSGDDQEMQEAGEFLTKAFTIALGLILVILVIQFNSALLPVIIVLSVLLSLIGVMWGLLICKMRFGVIMTGVGVISLAGIVVNNAIVLMDCVRQRKEDGLDTSSAVIEAGRLRLRPVLLTAVTTILGLIPMAVGYSIEFHEWPPRIIAGAESSQWWAPMAVAVIFGLGVATVLTLVLVPLMYSIADSIVKFLGRCFGRLEE